MMVNEVVCCYIAFQATLRIGFFQNNLGTTENNLIPKVVPNFYLFVSQLVSKITMTSQLR